MNETSNHFVEPKHLRLLRRMVMALLGVMILGFLILIIMLVMYLRPGDEKLPLPDAILLPDGTTAEAFTQGPDWFAIVTTDRRILIYDRVSGKLRQTMDIEK